MRYNLETMLPNRGGEQVIVPPLIAIRVANRTALANDTTYPGMRCQFASGAKGGPRVVMGPLVGIQ